MVTKKEFEIVEHTADIAIRAYGENMLQIFTNAAKAMFSLITNLEKVRGSVFRDIEIAAQDQEMLLVEWLNELVYFFDAEQLIFSSFKISVLTENGLKARCYGEKIDKSRHKIKVGIKSATYHMLKIQKNNIYSAQVLFDI